MQKDLNRCDSLIISSEEDCYVPSQLNSPNFRSPYHTRNFRQVFLRAYEKKDARPSFPQSLRSVRHICAPNSYESAETKLLYQKIKSTESDKIHQTSSLKCCSKFYDPNKHKYQVTFARTKYSSSERSDTSNEHELCEGRKENLCDERTTRKQRKKSKSQRRKQQRQQQHRHRRRPSPSSDNSKSSLIVLYRGEREPTSSRSSSCATRNSCGQSLRKLERSASIESRVSPRSRAAICRRSARKDKKYEEQPSEFVPVSDDWIKSEQVAGILARRGLSKSAECVDVLQKERKHSCARSRRRLCPRPNVVLASDTKVKEENKHRHQHRDSIGFFEEPCHKTFNTSVEGSRLMAQRSNSQAKILQQKKTETIEPNLGLLMQHLQDRHIKGTGDNPASININNSQRIFPFQATPSGNLKIIPNQVVFESKKVSVLVAEPRHAKVNVKAEQGRGEHATANATTARQQQQQQQHQSRVAIDLPPGVTASTVDRLQAQRKLPAHVDLGAVECRPRTQPYNRAKAQQSSQQRDMEDRQTGCALANRVPVIDDVPLSTLGFTFEQPIDWKNITLPEKTDLYQELSRRITTYKNADCIVRIGNDEFHCHLLVLQSYSTFFDDKNVKEIDLTGSSVTSRAFSIIYDWMISPTSESCHLLRRDNILEIFLAAQYLGIKELEEQCWAFIDNDELFSEDTAFLLYLEARKIGNTAIMELMVPRIMKFFLMLVSTKDFLELSVEELCLLLRSNYICVNSEMEVLMSAVRWLMHDWEGRKQYLLEVMKCVRFGLIAPWQLVDVKRNPENPEFMELMSYPEIQKIVDDGLAFVIIKYWYGNQTEDYYHWIDLLGLSEPTNRNWAGEDKNYVTYREFLLYLEEYQKTKISELKNKKLHPKPSPPSSPPKEDSSSQSTPPIRTRMNHQNSKGADITSITSNSRPSKQSTETSGNNLSHTVAPCMMMPPEILNQYLNNIGKSGAKPVSKSTNVISKSQN